jgi:hypothetical protein
MLFTLAAMITMPMSSMVANITITACLRVLLGLEGSLLKLLLPLNKKE